MPTGTPDYSKACIYKIWSHLTDRIYIGSTCDMTKRWSQHKKDYKNWKKGGNLGLTSSYLLFDLVGVENCEIEWLHDFPCETKKQLNKEEGRVQRQYKDLLVNKKFNHGLEKAEYHKKYQEEHKTELAENSKKYREEHKTELAEKKKKYYEDHKTERAERGKKYNEEHKEERAEYAKKYNEEHKEERAEYAKKYREEHKTEIAEKQKKYEEEHKAERAEYRKKYYALKKEQQSK